MPDGRLRPGGDRSDYGVLRGCRVIRAHDAKPALQATDLAAALLRAADAGAP